MREWGLSNPIESGTDTTKRPKEGHEPMMGDVTKRKNLGFWGCIRW